MPSHIPCFCPCLQDIGKGPDPESSKGDSREAKERPLHTCYHGYQLCLRTRDTEPRKSRMAPASTPPPGNITTPTSTPRLRAVPDPRRIGFSFENFPFQDTFLYPAIYHTLTHIAWYFLTTFTNTDTLRLRSIMCVAFDGSGSD